MKSVTKLMGVPGMDQEARSGVSCDRDRQQEARSGFVAGGAPEDPGAATGINNKKKDRDNVVRRIRK